MELIFETEALDADGQEISKLDRLLVDPSKREVTNVVIRSPALSEEVIVPLGLVQGTDGGGCSCAAPVVTWSTCHVTTRAGRARRLPEESIWGRRTSPGAGPL